MAKEKTEIIVHPDKVLIKITQSEWNSLFSIKVRRRDGKEVELFSDVEENEGFERRFQQNLSVGTIVAVGTNVKGILKGDVAIIDYLVTSSDNYFVGFHNGNILVAIPAYSTYHTEDSPEQIDGRRAWVLGDFDTLSPLIGYVRMKKVYAMNPYVILEWEDRHKLKINKSGMMVSATDDICVRKIVAAHPDSGFKDGDMVLLKEADLFERKIDKKTISVIFESDVIGAI